MNISIYSPQWDPHDSYGILAERTAKAFERDGWHVNRLGLTPPDEKTTIIPSPGGIVLGYPTLIDQYGPLVQHGPVVAVTMFESTILPDGWVDNMNRCAAVVVPSQFCADVFRDNGVGVPIHVVKLGINEAYINVKRLPRRDRPYTFLAIADRGMRKGWDLAWHGFISAFGKDNEDVRLILKCREDGMKHLSSGDPNVEILRGDFSDEEMAELYARCDCMVFPTRGEGYGLPPREFVATGGMTIVTHWGGTREMLDEAAVYSIPYELVPAWPYHDKLRGCGEWAEPDIKALTELMRQVVVHEDALNRVNDLVVNDFRLNNGWWQYERRLVEIYDEVTDGVRL